MLVTIFTGSAKPSARRSQTLPRMLPLDKPRMCGLVLTICTGSVKPNSRRSQLAADIVDRVDQDARTAAAHLHRILKPSARSSRAY